MGKIGSKSLLCMGGWLAVALMVTGCATPVAQPVTARMYDMQSGAVIQATLKDVELGYGAITARTPDGESLTGEFTLLTPDVGFRPPFSVPADQVGSAGGSAEASSGGDKDNAGSAGGSIWGEGLSPAERFGFSAGSDAAPKGTATLVGERGTTVQMVLYTVTNPNLRQYQPDLFRGAGVAWDNHGNWYRVHLGNVQEE